MNRRLWQTVTSFICLIFLQGCLIDRLVELKNQLCKEGKVRLVQENGVSVVFDQPTLLDSDIIKIIGAEPTNKKETNGNEIYFEYVVVRKGDEASGIYNIPVSFLFIRSEGKYKLKKVHAKKNIVEFLSYDLLNQILKLGCETKQEGTTIEVNLKEVDFKGLPNFEGIKQLLGDPHQATGNTYAYYYGINSSNTAEIVISYDKEDGRMLKVKIIFFRYVLNVDFDNRIARGKLKDWKNSLGLAVKMFSL